MSDKKWVVFGDLTLLEDEIMGFSFDRGGAIILGEKPSVKVASILLKNGNALNLKDGEAIKEVLAYYGSVVPQT